MNDARPELLFLDRLASPIGTTLLVIDERGLLRALDFEDYEPRMHRLLRLHYGAAALVPGRASDEIRDGLSAYFAGDLSALESIVVVTAGTAFQREVWAALRRIPAGKTISYGALAIQLGRPRAMRAVGMANGSNPIGIVVPCHRVIGADASLTGYGGGIARKRWLLEHEGVQLPERRRAA